MKHIVSFSGGKDSTAMLLMMLEKGMQVDEVVFFDTGWEFPEMYKHIKSVENQTGIDITFVYPNETFDYYFYEYRSKKGNYIDKIGLSWPDFKNRWCTRYKINAIKKYCNSLGNHIIYEGIALNELNRKKSGKTYPLIEFNVTEEIALEYCYKKGFTWDGLYKIFNRVSCFCCPLKRISELNMLYSEKPELWQIMRKMDSKTWRNFRPDYKLIDLEKRFKEENKQLIINLY